jgi:predicted dehydrogenase
MNSKLRFAIVGAGRIAQTYLQAFEGISEAQLVAVADVCPERALALADVSGCAWYSSYKMMGLKSRVDAAIICTPPASHAEICFHLLHSGIHVLCEKPFCLDSFTARRLLAAARDSGVQLTMASKFRYAEDVVRAKVLLDSGLLGEPILCHNVFSSRVDMSSRWNSDARISGGGVLIDNGAHSFDIIRYFLGPLSELQVIEGKRSQGLPVEESVSVFVHSLNGVMGSIDLSWSLDREAPTYLTCYGSNGILTVGWKESRYRLSTSKDCIYFGKGYDKTQAFRSQIRNFARSILGEEQLVINGEDALASVEVIEAAYSALRQNHWVSVDTRPLENRVCSPTHVSSMAAIG